LPQQPQATTRGKMDNLAPANIAAGELPEGFTSADPQGGAVAAGGGGGGSSEKDDQKMAILQQTLTPEALARLRRIKLVKEQKATALENSIVSLAMSGKLPGRITEGKLIEMLERGVAREPRSSTISIQRKKYAFDSDEDDNDDDLM
jgi:programmed cell death protein 5